MFRPFHPRFMVPAWAGAEFGPPPFFMGGRSGCRGSFGGNWGDEPRTRRGDMKFILLELLLEGPQHGYELIKQLESRRGGFRRVSAGSVYPTLQMLEESGCLTSEPIDGKRVYTITEAGRNLLRDRTQQADSRSPYDNASEARPTELLELRRTLTELNEAVTQLARSGNVEQANRASELLAQVKRDIYAMLAQQ
jgi:DNA-binding PadR family transcriptional regulator